MKKWLFLLWLLIFAIFCIDCPWAGAENLEFVGGSNVGEFANNSSKLTKPMESKLWNDLALFSRDEIVYVKVNSFADDSGTDDVNHRLVIARLNTVVSMLLDIRGDKLEILESFGHIYVPGKNEVNKRFVAIEYFLPKVDEASNSQYLAKIEELKSNFTETVSSNVDRITKDLNTQSIKIEDIRKKLDAQSVQIGAIQNGLKEQDAMIGKVQSEVGDVKISLKSIGKETEDISQTLKNVEKSIGSGFESTKSSFKTLCLYGALALLVLALISFVKFRMVGGQIKNNHEATTEQNEGLKKDIKAVADKGLVIGKPKWREGYATKKIAGILYGFIYLYDRDEDGKELFYSHFRNARGKWVCRKQLKQLKASLKGCMEKTEFAESKYDLMDEGIIVILKKEVKK